MIYHVSRLVVAALSCVLLLSATQARAQQVSQGHGRSIAPATSAVNAPAPEGTININTATEQELQRLPGIGPARAAAIVALRQRVQRFHSADDLMRVRGIGHAGMRRMRSYISLVGDSTLRARPGRPVQNVSAVSQASR